MNETDEIIVISQIFATPLVFKPEDYLELRYERFIDPNGAQIVFGLEVRLIHGMPFVEGAAVPPKPTAETTLGEQVSARHGAAQQVMPI